MAVEDDETNAVDGDGTRAAAAREAAVAGTTPADRGAGADLDDSDIDGSDDGDFGDGETPARPLWQWLALGVVVLGLFIGLTALFAGLLRPAAAPPAPVALTLAAPELAPAQPAPDQPTPDQPAPATAPAMAPTAAHTPTPIPDPAPAASPQPAGPHVAVLITEAGVNAAATKRAIETLPAAVAIGFSPYAPSLPAQVAAARAAGHEVWIGVPMEPKRYPAINPGPNTLLTSMPAAENLRRLDWVLAKVARPDGVYSMMGSAFTSDAQALRPVLARLTERGLRFVDARSIGSTRGPAVARELKLAFALNDRFIDDKTDLAHVERALSDLSGIARTRGNAIGLTRPLPETLDPLNEWLAGLPDKGIALVPLSTMTRP